MMSDLIEITSDLDNDLIISNLFNAAANPDVMGQLSEERRKQLQTILKNYTEDRINCVLTSNADDAVMLRRGIKLD